MGIALKTTGTDKSFRRKRIDVQGTLSGAYTTGGIPVDLTTVTNPQLISGGTPAANPKKGTVQQVAAGYEGELIPGATMKTWALKLYLGGTELAAAAIPAALIADPLQLSFEGPKGNF